MNYGDSELLELLQQNVILSITDALGRISYANENFCVMMGYYKHELVGEVNGLLRSECDKDPKYKELWKTIKKGRIWNGVLCHRKNNGKPCWLDTTITPIVNSKGCVEKYVAVHNDITTIYEEKRALNDLEFKHSAFVESIPNLVVSINKLGKILTANRGIGSLTAEALLGTYIYGYVNPIHHDLVRKNVDIIFNGGKCKEYETMEYDAKGRTRYLLSQIGPGYNKQGEIISATIAISDITKFRKHERDTHGNDTKYHTFFKSIDVGIIVVADCNGNITEWNKGAELAFGYSESEIIGCHLTQLMSQKFRKASMKELVSAVNKLKTHRIQGTIEMYGLKKNGEEFPVEFALSKLKNGKADYFCAMMLDISKSKTLENKLKIKTKDLELFLYRSAHDLSAPFSSAEGIINLMNQEEKSPVVSQLTSMLDVTLQKGKSMLDNLALVATISDKKKHLQSINFDNLIDEIIRDTKETTHFQHIEFVTIVKGAGEFYFNPDLLKSLFENLIQNAVKFGNPPSKNFIPTVKIEVTSVKGNIQIVIADNGRGISEEHLVKIFDLYYRVNNDELPGEGIGLYFVKNIVDDLNGEIEVTSELSKGTCFKILLPQIIISQ
ncbi:PAS domain S-box-containing protein [Ulvibacter sp. MAR_2010_11]|nr:PAS domain S-box-containing protein [Ulvibacter sp. MAR_2010_11]